MLPQVVCAKEAILERFEFLLNSYVRCGSWLCEWWAVDQCGQKHDFRNEVFVWGQRDAKRQGKYVQSIGHVKHKL